MKALTRLREGLLAGSAGASDYWRGEGELSLCGRTFAQRIAWKWGVVLNELALRQWATPSRRLVGWGCDMGIATRRTLEQWLDQFDAIALSDRSLQARAFAVGRLREVHPRKNRSSSGSRGN